MDLTCLARLSNDCVFNPAAINRSITASLVSGVKPALLSPERGSDSESGFSFYGVGGLLTFDRLEGD